jgi:uncharacterized delta-60 repeat protein
MDRRLLGGLAVVTAALAAAPAVQARPGDVDPGFGTGGESLTHLSGRGASFGGMAAQSDGAIVATAFAPAADPVDYSRPVVLRLRANGLLDRSFGEGGAARLPMTLAAKPVVQADGKIVIAGSRRSRGVDQLTVVRLKSDGDRDKEFGDNGVVTPAAGAGLWPHAAIVQEDGNLVAVGAVVNESKRRLDNFTLVRLRSDGSTDPSFGDDGHVTTPTGEDAGLATAILEQDGGRLVVGGHSSRDVRSQSGNVAHNTWLLRRYRADGKLDATFGSNGAARFEVEDSTLSSLAGLVESEDGRIVGAGEVWFELGIFSTAHIAVAQFGLDGQVDAGFGSSGSVLTQVPAEQTGNRAPSQGWDLAIQRDGRIVVVGRYLGDSEPFSSGWAIVRYRPDGSLDTGFGRSGFVTSVRGQSQAAESILVQPGGRLVVGGTSTDCGRPLVTLVRYFGEAGADGGPTMRACATTVPLGPDGELPLSVQCPFVEDECKGTVSVEIPPTELTSSARRARRPVKVGAERFSLASGAMGEPSVTAKGRGLELLRKQRAKRAVLVFVARDGEGHRRVTRRKIKVRAAR